MSQNLQVEGGPRTRSSRDDTADLRTSGGAASSNPVSSFSSFDGPADAASGALGRRGAMPREEIGGGMETDENEIDSCSCLLNGRQDSYQFLLNMIAALPGDARYDQATAICGALGDDEWRAGRMGGNAHARARGKGPCEGGGAFFIPVISSVGGMWLREAEVGNLL